MIKLSHVNVHTIIYKNVNKYPDHTHDQVVIFNGFSFGFHYLICLDLTFDMVYYKYYCMSIYIKFRVYQKYRK